MTHIMSSAELARLSNLRPFGVCEDVLAGKTSGIGQAFRRQASVEGGKCDRPPPLRRATRDGAQPRGGIRPLPALTLEMPGGDVY